ncbi:hypothetical protein BSL78_04872 [Apostichopus japonicus]|uniref:Uncharacterized protein n=1 Tax=Stichopus japonicus TaxID=307972 RepID=A0A2G8LD94_STIJA|nr:hypothetical protein BSL78_04872 [Apostichopus japonicus]
MFGSKQNFWHDRLSVSRLTVAVQQQEYEYRWNFLGMSTSMSEDTSEFLLVTEREDQKGPLSGVKLGVYYPGFPTCITLSLSPNSRKTTSKYFSRTAEERIPS